MGQEDAAREHEIDELLASLPADAADARVFLSALATRLDGALPGQVTIERRGGLFARDHPVKRIELTLGDARYGLIDEGHGRLAAIRTRVVRGVALATERLDIDAWLVALAGDLRELAASSVRGHEALQRLLLGR